MRQTAPLTRGERVRNQLESPCTGPVRTVVWQGSVGDRRPYADQQALPPTAAACNHERPRVRASRWADTIREAPPHTRDA